MRHRNRGQSPAHPSGSTVAAAGANRRAIPPTAESAGSTAAPSARHSAREWRRQSRSAQRRQQTPGRAAEHRSPASVNRHAIHMPCSVVVRPPNGQVSRAISTSLCNAKFVEPRFQCTCTRCGAMPRWAKKSCTYSIDSRACNHHQPRIRHLLQQLHPAATAHRRKS